MLRAVIIAACVGWAAPASAAEPIFLPDFTPGSPDQFAVSVMVQGMVADRLLQEGHIVLTSEVVQPVVGSDLVVNCASRVGCPNDVLPRIPTRVAVVVRIDQAGEGLNGHVELFEQSSPKPLDVRDVPMNPGQEAAFADEVAAATKALLERVGPSPDTVLMAAARLIAGQPPSVAPPAQPVPVSPTPPAPVPAPVTPTPQPPAPMVDLDDPNPVAPVPGRTTPLPPGKKGDGTTPHEGPLEPILEGTGVQRRHLVGAEASFMASGLDPRDWVYENMPHAGRLTFEVRGGLGMGDVNRDADIRVETSAGQQQNAWYQEGPTASRRVRGSVYLGYAPATMVDLGVVAGLQYGIRRISTGTYEVDAAGVVVSEPDIQAGQIVQAIQFFVQPRARLYVVPIGPVKPFAFVGADFRVFDRYQIDQPANLVYPVPEGAVIPGFAGGGGLMIDPGPIVGLFAEGGYTRHFGPRAAPVQFQDTPWPEERIEPLPAGSGGTIGITGGVQFRLVIRRVLEGIGRSVIAPVEDLGRAGRILGAAVVNLFVLPLRVRLTVKQIEFIGIQSLPIILLSSAFTGAVFTYESFDAFALFGAQGMVGGTVGVAITRELAPTLTGLLVAGRAGSAMAAEIGSMRVSEQIDALNAMAVDPVNYLVKPRLIASIVVLPLLTAVFDFVGILGSYVVGVYVLHLSPPEYLVRLQEWVDWDDIWAGLIKAVVFGAIIGTVSCYKGYYTTGGAAGVGRATTSAVVVASVTILVANYFIALMLPSAV